VVHFSTGAKAISVIDYGLGNVQAFANLYSRLGFNVVVAKTAADIANARCLVMPGVGSFDWAMGRLNSSGMRESLDKMVLDVGVPVLGVCVGMQIMADYSAEGVSPGLGWISGGVRAFEIPDNGDMVSQRLPVPHMGWNAVKPAKEDGLFAGLAESHFYFLHSYFFDALDTSNSLAFSNYLVPFVSAINRDNIYGVQFHPEKSHSGGVRLLQNFASL